MSRTLNLQAPIPMRTADRTRYRYRLCISYQRLKFPRLLCLGFAIAALRDVRKRLRPAGWSVDAAWLGRRYNHDGVGGLSDARRSGRPLALSADQLEEVEELKAPVIAGPDSALHGVSGWRCLDECTVGRMLQRMGLM